MRGQISAHAGADQGDGFAADGAVDHGELAGEGEVGEIALGKVGDFDSGAAVAQILAEKAGLAGGRAGGEAVQVDDAVHFLVAGGAGMGCRAR